MLFALCSTLLDWSVRLELHQHPSGYEPGALLLSYGPMKVVGYPGAAPGYSCFQGKRVLLALSYPMKSGRAPRTRTGLRGLANHWLDDFAVRTIEIGLLSRYCPDAVSFTKSGAAITP